MIDEYRYFAYNTETGRNIDVLPFEECIEILRYRYNHIKDMLQDVLKENGKLKNSIYKDDVIQELQCRIKEMEADYYRGFPINKDQDDAINIWIKKHQAQKHNGIESNSCIGGQYSYHFYPTAIGTSGTIRCSCGAEFEFMELK